MGSMISQEPKGFDSPYIQFVHVYKSFQDTPVLYDVNFEVRRGETVVVLGKSGVGKSVTLKHILGFLHPDAGQVFVAGQEVSKMPEEELSAIRRKVTMVFQSGALFDSLTVSENVAYPLRERAERGLAMDESKIQEQVAELLAMVELEAFRPEHRQEAGCSHCAGAGGGAGRDSVRRTYDHGGPADGPDHSGADFEAEAQERAHFGGGDSRHETGAQARRSGRLPRGRARGVLRSCG